MTARALLPLVVGWTLCASAHPAEPIVIGSKKFTENIILGDLAVQLLESGGFEAEHRRELGGTRFLWNALVQGAIDAYPEYTGTITQEILADRGVRGVEAIRDALSEYGVRMGAPLGFNNTYAIGMKRERAGELGLESLSDLRNRPELRMGFTNEFMDRGDGWPGLRDAYRLPHENVTGLDHDLAYRGLESGALDVTDLYSTDAEIRYYDLKILEDDLDHFPEYQAVILYREDLERRHPGAAERLAMLEGRIAAEEMTAMNAAAKLDGVPEALVAAGFMRTEFGIEVTPETSDFWSRLWRRTAEHLALVGASMAAAVLIAVPLGVAAAKIAPLGQVILGAVGIVQTIPALALLVFMIPPLGIGAMPAMAALFLYSLLPIVRNTHAGLGGIAPAVRESAEAMGLPPGAILWRVELPLAARSILAGIKIAAVINIGTATLGALIGAGGYGQPILTGIRLDNMGLILEGAVPAALMAVAAQGLFELAERLAVPRGLRLRRA